MTSKSKLNLLDLFYDTDHTDDFHLHMVIQKINQELILLHEQVKILIEQNEEKTVTINKLEGRVNELEKEKNFTNTDDVLEPYTYRD